MHLVEMPLILCFDQIEDRLQHSWRLCKHGGIHVFPITLFMGVGVNKASDSG